MKKSKLLFLPLSSLILLLVSFLVPSLLSDLYAQKLEVKPTIRVRPATLSFDCTIALRAKKIVVTNITKKTLDIQARAEQPWILVEPQMVDKVPPAGTAAFTVSINCKEPTGTKPYVGNVLVTGGDFGQKVPVTVKPGLEIAPPPKPR